MQELDKAYIAGLFDGEGCVFITKQKPDLKNKRINPSHWLVAVLSNTDKNVMDWLLKTTGLGFIGTTLRKENYKRIYRWVLNGNSAFSLLTVIYPHLIIKKKQTEIGLYFHSKKQNLRYKLIPKDELDFRENCRKQLMNLNKRGI